MPLSPWYWWSQCTITLVPSDFTHTHWFFMSLQILAQRFAMLCTSNELNFDLNYKRWYNLTVLHISPQIIWIDETPILLRNGKALNPLKIALSMTVILGSNFVYICLSPSLDSEYFKCQDHLVGKAMQCLTHYSISIWWITEQINVHISGTMWLKAQIQRSDNLDSHPSSILASYVTLDKFLNLSLSWVFRFLIYNMLQ